MRAKGEQPGEQRTCQEGMKGGAERSGRDSMRPVRRNKDLSGGGAFL
jgi:hypothetical protein